MKLKFGKRRNDDAHDDFQDNLQEEFHETEDDFHVEIPENFENDFPEDPAEDTSLESNSGGRRLMAPVKAFWRKKWAKRVVALALVCALVVTGVSLLGKNQNAASAANIDYTLSQVERRSISADITGSGTLEAANSYSVSTLIEGSILTAEFEEGDQVEQGTVLYTLDSSDVSSSLEQAEISLYQSQRSYQNKVKTKSDLTAQATASGQIISLEVEVGDEVSAGQTLAIIRDSDTMELTVPFPADDVPGFYIGQDATVTLDSTFERLSGTVTKISAVENVSTGNMILRDVTISVSNPGGISTEQNATGEVAGITSSSGAAFQCQNEAIVAASASGEVASIHVFEGARVSKNQNILTISSDTISDDVQTASESVRNAQLTLDNRYKQLDDYTITSPIAGTVIDKNYKAGETSEANQVLCTIYDLSYLTMTLAVDELDISDIEVGQRVTITADAVENRVYDAVVTKVSVAGTFINGVTTYPVTIRIEEADGLLPGMSADATIVLGNAENVLSIPSAALMRGNQVLVTADSPSAKNGNSIDSFSDVENADSQSDFGNYVSVPVTVGVSDGNYTEILSGLQEGDTVAYIQTSGGMGSDFIIMGDMGGMPSGDMPNGGVSVQTSTPGGGGGGMPSGGRGGF